METKLSGNCQLSIIVCQLFFWQKSAKRIERLKKAYDAALAAGKWKDTYAATNIEEYWAEGVQDWFNVNAEVPKTDGKHNQVNTRKELKAYDRGLYDILSEFFPATNEQISCHKYINKYRK